jgi:hypothetical protein
MHGFRHLLPGALQGGFQKTGYGRIIITNGYL